MSDTEYLRQQLEEERARSADIRVRLQKLRGVLWCFRHTEDFGKPTNEWRWNPDAMRDIMSLYNLPELLDSTSPDKDTGVAFLLELRELREANKKKNDL